MPNWKMNTQHRPAPVPSDCWQVALARMASNRSTENPTDWTDHFRKFSSHRCHRSAFHTKPVPGLPDASSRVLSTGAGAMGGTPLVLTTSNWYNNSSIANRELGCSHKDSMKNSTNLWLKVMLRLSNSPTVGMLADPSTAQIVTWSTRLLFPTSLSPRSETVGTGVMDGLHGLQYIDLLLYANRPMNKPDVHSSCWNDLSPIPVHLGWGLCIHMHSIFGRMCVNMRKHVKIYT